MFTAHSFPVHWVGSSATKSPQFQPFNRLYSQLTFYNQQKKLSVRRAIRRKMVPGTTPEVFGSVSRQLTVRQSRGYPLQKDPYMGSSRHNKPYGTPTTIDSCGFSLPYSGALATERCRCNVHSVTNFYTAIWFEISSIQLFLSKVFVRIKACTGTSRAFCQMIESVASRRFAPFISNWKDA